MNDGAAQISSVVLVISSVADRGLPGEDQGAVGMEGHMNSNDNG